MVENNFIPFTASNTTIDTCEIRWAAQELSAIVRQLDPNSPAAMLLRQARKELQSMMAAERPGVVPTSPLRVAA